jgi:hypothetical protein
VDNERLRRLLDGDIDAGQLANDGVLASIADRVYGIKVDPAIRPTKPRDALAIAEANSTTPEPAASLLVEVIPGGPSVAPASPMLTGPMPGDLAPLPPVVKPVEVASRGNGGLLLGLLGFALVLVNMYWGLGNLINACSGHVSCTSSMKLNWLEVYRTSEHIAWGPTGAWGIPDIVAAGASGLLLLLGLRRR